MMIKILYEDVDSVYYIFLIKMIEFQTIQIADGFAKKKPTFYSIFIFPTPPQTSSRFCHIPPMTPVLVFNEEESFFF